MTPVQIAQIADGFLENGLPNGALGFAIPRYMPVEIENGVTPPNPVLTSAAMAGPVAAPTDAYFAASIQCL